MPKPSVATPVLSWGSFQQQGLPNPSHATLDCARPPLAHLSCSLGFASTLTLGLPTVGDGHQRNNAQTYLYGRAPLCRDPYTHAAYFMAGIAESRACRTGSRETGVVSLSPLAPTKLETLACKRGRHSRHRKPSLVRFLFCPNLYTLAASVQNQIYWWPRFDLNSLWPALLRSTHPAGLGRPPSGANGGLALKPNNNITITL